MLDPSTEARITAAGERFMAGELSAGELLDRAASALWEKGADDMAMRYDPPREVGESRHLVPVAQHSNGQHLEVRTVEVKLAAPYEGFGAVMRINPRRSVLDGLKSGDTDKAIAAAFALIVRWQFWDEDGAPIPLTAEAVYDLPDDLLAALLRGYFETFVEAVTPDKSDATGAEGLPR